MRSLIVVTMLTAAATAAGQQPADPQFDVVSIRPYRSAEPGGRNAIEPGRYEGIGVTLRRLIALAYLPLPTDLIDGGPGWMATDRFDVHTTFTGNPPRETIQRMLRAMLAERFKLRMHRETRPTPVLELTVERAGVGPSLRQASIDCANRPNGSTPDVPWCAFQYTSGLLHGRGVTLDQIAAEIDADRLVVNRTGLAGRWDIDLKWTADPAATTDANAPPGLVTALREQLGLRLQSGTALLEHLVIDSVEQPTPD